MYKWAEINIHKDWNDEKLNIDYIVLKFMELLRQTKYITLQRYKTAHDMFTAREINGVIVAGNSTYLDSVEAENAFILPDEVDVVSFDRLWVFTDKKKLENYLKILIQAWKEEDCSAGNVEDEIDFLRRLEFWDNTQFYRTGCKGSCAWNDTIMDYALGFRKPREVMEKLTGDNLEDWPSCEDSEE